MNKDIQYYDLAVIGSGPGGEGAAMQASKEGLKVTVIEKNNSVGGNCTHLGTIPSKSLRYFAQKLSNFENDPLFHSQRDYSTFSFTNVLSRAKEVINKQVARRKSHYSRNTIKVFHGNAKIEDANTINVQYKNMQSETIKAKNIIIATGSKPYRPENINFENPHIFDSDSILDLSYNPKKIIIYGAGVVGCEYACIFRALGIKVTLINNKNSLLPFLDDEISDALSYHFRDKGIQIRYNESCKEIEEMNDGLNVMLNSGKKLRCDALLVTLGRSGNTDDLWEENLNIKTNKKKNILVNKNYQSCVENIYAVGDITGFPCLASAAYDQGRFATLHILDKNCDTSLLESIPVGIYTTPEISCIGKTESELTEEKIPYEVGHVCFKHLARAQILGQTTGILKILFHSETLELLGIHCFGENASEIVHIGQAVMCQKGSSNSLKYFINTTFNYPTMAEAYRVAALNGLNRLQGK